MRALVVYESMYGNTRAIAEAIAAGLESQMHVEMVEVSQAPGTLEGVDLLIVGAPTHALGLSRDATRASAAEQAGRDVISADGGLREWLDVLEVASGARAAAFDTHVDKRVPGSAAKAARRRLRRMGLQVIAPAESFYVSGMEGPLLAGEIERAREWAMRLGQPLVTADA